ncbi:MAG: RsmD family RNA methyltransferase [Candidatus Thermoplasmatota archaeon]|nr:RsmD family RNA methyltransferase [Candidatus Thermoplasmatota archaeon]
MKFEGFQLVEFSGEHPNLPISDALGCLRGLGVIPSKVVYERRFLAFRPGVDLRELALRAALGRYVGEVLISGTLEEVRRRTGEVDLRGRSFRLRVVDYTGSVETPSLEAALGGSLASTGRVDLEDPEVDLRLIISEGACLFRVEAVVDRAGFESRKVERRPSFRPVGLHPKFARALVNLTGVSKGETLLDPFSGTGGILLEAALVGARAAGSDVKEDVLEGCRENLHFFGLEADMRVCDVGDIVEEFDRVDAIATDPPYGRAAGTMGERLPRLIERAFEAFRGVLKVSGRVAICLPKLEYIDLGKRYLRLLEWHSLPVHRSLIRHFSVFEKPR